MPIDERTADSIREPIRQSFLVTLARRDELADMSVGELRKLANAMAYDATKIAIEKLST